MPSNQPGYHGVKLKRLPVVFKYAGTATCEPVSPPVISDEETSSWGWSDMIVMKMTTKMTAASNTRSGVQNALKRRISVPRAGR